MLSTKAVGLNSIAVEATRASSNTVDSFGSISFCNKRSSINDITSKEERGSVRKIVISDTFWHN